jgi:hypothetical protein
MTLLLISDCCDDESKANPHSEAAKAMTSPLQLMQENAVHGGTWRAPFKTNSYTEVCAVLYFLGLSRPYVAAAAVLGAGAVVARSRL